MTLIKYILRRILITIPILFVVLFITFVFARLMPGNPFINPEEFVGIGGFETIDELIHEMGLDKPILEQFWLYLNRLFTGDWGGSLIYVGYSAWEIIASAMPITIELAIISTFLSTIIGIKAGVFTAKNRNNSKDATVRGIMLLGVSIPVFWLGMILQYLFAYVWDIFPMIGFKDITLDDPSFITGLRLLDSLLTGRFDLWIDTVWHLILPVFCLTFIQTASITRQSRANMLEVLELDYIRYARAKGCPEKTVINKHALRNAIIPTITIIGMNFGGILGGAVLTETTFSLNGLGMLLVETIIQKDYFVLQALVFLITLLFIVVNLAVDVVYALLDPRIRYGK
jgi:ABC-type dipeptide/oligopeptide/nickel transport system permease component